MLLSQDTKGSTQSSAVLLIQNGHYLLQHRDDRPGIADPGSYGIWGGISEDNESPEDSARRELLEETGVRVKLTDLNLISEFTITGGGPVSFGKPQHVFLYSLELSNDVVVKCYEGQELIKLPVATALEHPKLNNLSRQAIEIYEEEQLLDEQNKT